LSLDIAGKELPDFRIVIDDENALGGWAHLTGKEDWPSSNPLLASPRRFNEGIFCNENQSLGGAAMFRHKSRAPSNVRTRQDQQGQRCRLRREAYQPFKDART
jgi:hypothetical protein